MAKMVNCKTCGAEIAKSAKRCPNCGAKRKGKKGLLIFIGIVVVLVIFFIALGSDNPSSSPASGTNGVETTISEAEFKGKCESVAYKDIARNPAEYEGKYVKFTGQVIQVQEYDYTESIYRIDVTQDEYGFWDDTVYVTYMPSEGESRILEDDIVTFYGVCTGTTSYTSVMGDKITIPSVEAQFMEITE